MLKKLQTETFSGITTTISFDENGDVKEDFILYIVKNEQFTPLEI